MKGKFKCLSFLAVFIGLFTVFMSFPVYAADYGAQYPSYLNQSSACFIEVQSNLGKGSIVLPKNYQFDYVSFYGNGYNLFNSQSGTISGYFVLTNGTTYSLRASGFSTFQYQDNISGISRYYDLTVSQIYNTNVQLSDEKGDRGNTIYDNTFFEKFVMSALAFIFSIIAISIIFQHYR